MIKEFRFQNWKSFGESVLYIDPLTFVIGTNASGKSNILDAISFLSDSAKGIPINDIAKQARGGLDWIVRKGAEAFRELFSANVGRQNRTKDMLQNAPTDDQAEVLVYENIPVSMIKGIAFEKSNDCSICHK